MLEDNDELIIYSKEDPNQIVWSGKIELIRHPLFTESAREMWIHTDQKGVDREIWARWFFEKYPAKLIKFRPL
ncbi:MAG: hypothetical protein A2750_02430 [Candidatus Yanofskybacteria bacterium RIFCSPHIGHO2_01_FULL_45_42]|uniref:Uncharacterized protein n=2 Tax=Candidatus Yanofskyibacteriota TaxID=1752733 RepID=A0A1F8EZK1_9BACT|nr:MAG: hypothetical protein A2750_02430 [Candidatus Yanofskybacteria bacterium RIFCSPHIGHO2_01_FULL_45_42]OGN16287.1 MAG: hypothetical protein A3C81_00780 [Candidatus Yanofskybacteria bacterium RIFCSPHIGHO2_02_FULL_46_19]